MEQGYGLAAEPGPWARLRRPADHHPARQAGTLLHGHPHGRRPNRRRDRRRPHIHMEARQHATTGSYPRPSIRRVPLPAGRSRQPLAGRARIRPAHLHLGQPTARTHAPPHRTGCRVHQHQHERRPAPGRGPAGTGTRLSSNTGRQPKPEPETRSTGSHQPARSGASRPRRHIRQPNPHRGHRRAGLDPGDEQHRKSQTRTHQTGTGHAHRPSPSPQPRSPSPRRGRTGLSPG